MNRNFLGYQRHRGMAILAVMAVGLGCGPPGSTIDTQYGRARGANYSSSVNGSSVLIEMIKSQYTDVRRQRQLSPRIENYETMVWIPDNRHPPSADAIRRLEQWLAGGYDRLLIYVGRDFEAQAGYWRQMVERTTGDQRQRALRQLAHAVATEDAARASAGLGGKCDWFETQSAAVGNESAWSGPWSDDLHPDRADLQARSLLIPPSHSPGRPAYHVRQLLLVDGSTFAYSLSKPQWDGGQIVVITNGCFLLNLPLVNRENRRLAGKVVELCTFDHEILFLESGPGEIRIDDRDSPQYHSQWSWITQPPLSYIVPHFLFLGLLFCFVYFPIFGRPRRLAASGSSDFRAHVDAVGRMLARGGQAEHAQARIRQCSELLGTDSRRREEERQ